MNEKQLNLLNSTIFLKESLEFQKDDDRKSIVSLKSSTRLSNTCMDIETSIDIGLKKANTIAKKRDYTPIKSKSELKMSEKDSLPEFTKGEFKIMGNQLVFFTNERPNRGILAIYKDGKGKVKTIRVEFMDRVKNSCKIIAISLKKANAIAKEKGYTSVKSKNELKNTSSKINFTPKYFQVINKQLIAYSSKDPNREAFAIYKDEKEKLRTIKIEFNID
ncbi:hypothetical protein Bp8pS_213 [Bacillus phage vB_BpuM-BpSp]|nr:hypothetical protein Bp8pS_213 [Bacillus phage vB_BpuM-BpSp]